MGKVYGQSSAERARLVVAGVKPAVPQERWSSEEDAALLAAIETTPRHERSGEFRWKAICKAAGLRRKAHAIRNRAGRLALEGMVSE